MAVHLTGEANDAWQLPNGDIVFAYKAGARELTPGNKSCGTTPPRPGSEIHSCQPLAGRLLARRSARRRHWLSARAFDSAGKLQKTVTIQVAGGLGAHGQFREVRKTSRARISSLPRSRQGARSRRRGGNVLREFPCGASSHPFERRQYAGSCGDDHRVVEVDAQGSVVGKSPTGNPGHQLGLPPACSGLGERNTIICNWPGHGGVPAANRKPSS